MLIYQVPEILPKAMRHLPDLPTHIVPWLRQSATATP